MYPSTIFNVYQFMTNLVSSISPTLFPLPIPYFEATFLLPSSLALGRSSLGEFEIQLEMSCAVYVQKGMCCHRLDRSPKKGVQIKKPKSGGLLMGHSILKNQL